MTSHPHSAFSKITIPIFSIIFSLLCFTPKANAEPNPTVANINSSGVHVGALQFHPYLILEEVQSDNIYSTSTDTKHDYITRITPGLKLDLPVGKHDIQLNYNAVLERYGKYVEENTSDHNAGVSGEMNLASRFKIKLSDDYRKGHEPRGSSSTGFIEKFWTNKTGATLQYSLTDLSKVRYDFTYDKWDFMSSKFRNRHDWDNSLYVYYRIMAKTSVFAEYDHKRAAYELRAPDLTNRTNGGQLGLTWEISERSKGTIKTGYQRKDFSDKSLNAHGSWIYSVDVSHDFSSKTSVKLIGERTINEANLQGTNYFLTTGGRAELSQRIYTKFMASLNGSYGVDKFSNAVIGQSPLVRRDVTVTGGGAVKYMMQDWLDFSLGYTSKKRNSNIDVNDYYVNEYMLQINMAL